MDQRLLLPFTRCSVWVLWTLPLMHYIERWKDIRSSSTYRTTRAIANPRIHPFKILGLEEPPSVLWTERLREYYNIVQVNICIGGGVRGSIEKPHIPSAL